MMEVMFNTLKSMDIKKNWKNNSTGDFEGDERNVKECVITRVLKTLKGLEKT